MSDFAREVLQGAYDLHIHFGPDVRPRKCDEREMARRFLAAGMKGFALKSHFTPTVERALLVNQEYPGLHAVGGVGLNSSVGGLNPFAVEAAGRLGGRFGWVPTMDAAHDMPRLRQYLPAFVEMEVKLESRGVPGAAISLLNEEGTLRPEVFPILEIIRDYRMVLATGHISPREGLLLVQAGRDMEAELREKGLLDLYNQVELPLVEVLYQMEREGFMVDGAMLRELSELFARRLEEIQQGIYQQAGESFNILSTKQLGVILFEKLGLPTRKKTKTGYSTDSSVLESLQDHHPIVPMVMEYRFLSKLKSTFLDGLLALMQPDGRVHTSFNQNVTATGRISSTEPNLQNIPVRTELGRELRKFFLAKEGWVLVDADYSQIELRVLAHIAHDENMIKAFQDKEDIHTITASQVFGMPPEMVTPLMRSRAKAVNFGIVYGIGAFSLSKDINVSRKEAQRYIDDYLTLYSGVDRYMKEVVEKAKEDGYVETLFHRRRYLPELTASNFNLRAFGERVARNMPIQGTAADIIKIAMVRVDRRLKRENMRARLILQVHDELIVEAPEDEAEQAARILTEEMEGAVSLTVPMVAEASVGKTWYDAKG